MPMHPALRDLMHRLNPRDFEEWRSRWVEECHASVRVDRYTFERTKNVDGYREMLRGQRAKEMGLFIMTDGAGRGVEAETSDDEEVTFRSSVMVLRSYPVNPETMKDRRPVMDGSVPPRPPLAWVVVSDNPEDVGRRQENNLFAMDEVGRSSTG